MKITIYELINKIKKGEKLPKKIKYDKHIYEYEEGTYDWSYYIENNGTIKFLLTDVFNGDDNILDILNEEVKVIEEEPRDIEVCGSLFTKSEYDKLAHCEEEKKIPEKLDISGGISVVNCAYKINEIIDYIKSKGDE